MTDTSTVELATELTIAWLSNPSTRADAEDVRAFVTAMNATLGGLSAASVPPQEEEARDGDHPPAVSVRKSLASRDHIISMIDGRPYRTLKRHLSTRGLTPDEYRARYNLKADYPMVAPSYSESRRETAKRLGLGRKPAVATEAAPPAKPRGRKSAADAKAAAKRHLGG